MPFKTFTAGSAATASDVQTYLMNQVVIVCTSGTRPAAPVEGMHIYESDTDKLLTYDGAVWNLPKNVAGGTLGYAQVSVSQTGISTETDLAGLSVTVTVGAGRRIRVTGAGTASAITTGGSVYGRIKEGTTELGRWLFSEDLTAGKGEFSQGAVILTPSAGAHTYKLTLTKFAGGNTTSLDASATQPAYIHVEDVGT